MTFHLPSTLPQRASPIQKKPQVLDHSAAGRTSAAGRSNFVADHSAAGRNNFVAADGKIKHSMGSSASSSTNSTHRAPLTSSLPGGNDATWLKNNYNKNRRLLTKEKVPNPHVYKSSSPSRVCNQGPLKGDHNINIPIKDIYNSKEKPVILKPLSHHRKSCSLSDLSTFNYRDRDIADIDFHFPDSDTGEPAKMHKRGFAITKGCVTDTMRNISDACLKKTEELKNISKFRLLNHRPSEKCPSSSNNVDRIIDGIRTLNTLGKIKSPEDDLPGRRYRSLSDLSMSNNVSIIRPIAGSSRQSSYDENDIVSREKRSGLLDDTKKTYITQSTANGRRHSFDNGKTNITFGCGLVGLRNLGNTCFMNSILQCLCKTKLLRDYFWKKHYQRDLNEDHAPTKGKLAKAFGQLMNDMWSKNEIEYITPSLLKSEVQKYAVRFSGYHQQDAQEFLRFFIEGIHDDLNSVKRKPAYSPLDDSSMNDCEKSDVYWERYLSRERSMIQDLFVGQLKSTLTCTVCDHRSVTYDPFWDLSLPIPTRIKMEDINISRCFRAFTQEEILDGDEKPTCEKCKKRRKCMKRFLIEIFPKILVIHLKRFSGHRYRTKLDSKVNFPFELNLSNFAANSFGVKQTPIYSLYGVSNHMGGTHGGHYTAYCKHPDTDRWHVYNDSRVNEISSNKLVTSSAYVLFYELVSNGSSTG